MGDKGQQTLTFGFDIGIASVGWCVLGENRIVDLGVRCFDKAETPDKGESLNKARRDARLMRRRLRRRAWRLTKLTRLLKREGIIVETAVLKQEPSKGFKTPNLWQLRVKALDTRLDSEEWARVIYHLVKHRGFHWVSKAEERQAEGDKKEGGPIKQAIKDNRQRMAELGRRSAAELMLTDFPDAQRNKQGSYNHALPRTLLAEELALLFERQRDLCNPHADSVLEEKVTELFWAQKPPLSGKSMLERIGRCTFEKDGGPDGKGEYRAPKASFSAERQVWLTRLNNLRINVDGITRRLNSEEHRVALPLPYEYDTDLTYKRLHDALVKAGLLPASFTFSGLRGVKKDGDPLKETLAKVPAWQELRKSLKKAGLETEWKGMAGVATGGDPSLLDDIAWVLTVYKTDDEAKAELRKLALPNPDQMIPALLDFPRSSFKAFHSLSLKALRKIVPHMAAGLRYDEACELAGYRHSQPNPEGAKEKYLPAFYEHARGEDGKLIFSERIEREITGGIPRNPVVLRALNQARKVCNALIREYGSPAAVHIELARDLSRPLVGHPTRNGGYFDGRRDIENAQKEARARNEQDWIEFKKMAESMGLDEPADRDRHGREFAKWQLYREQHGKCLYSLEPIDINRLLERGYVEIDHALPYSRSFDDSKNNKVLVRRAENQNKGNQTPYEYLTSFTGGEDGERWRNYVAYVEATYPGLKRTAKRSRLLRKNFGKDEAADFRARNLNDTRYICKFFKNYVERYLDLAPKVGAGGTAEEKKNERCVVLSGQLTAFLRARWGLAKVRDESDRHHAMDAAVVAACSHGMVQRLSNYSRRHELEDARSGYINAETGEVIDREALLRLEAHFPKPWRHFQEELLARLKIDDQTALRETLTNLGTYPVEIIDTLRPLFVSRAPQRRNSGAVHEETIRSEKLMEQESVSYVKVPLHKLKLARLSDIVGATYSRNAPLIALLRERLEKANDDGKKAFAEPVFKPSSKEGKDGKGSLVRSVKLASTQKSGIRIRGGVAELGGMHHVDVFRYGTGYHIEPAYEAFSDKRIKPECIPTNAEFLFSLSKSDFVKIRLGEITYEGYFVMYESDGRLTLRAHDQPKPDKDYFRKSVTNAASIQKFHVDVLGNIYPAPPEQRRGLA
jgi:CRISPR-associated endonuclease Csn1